MCINININRKIILQLDGSIIRAEISTKYKKKQFDRRIQLINFNLINFTINKLHTQGLNYYIF